MRLHHAATPSNMWGTVAAVTMLVLFSTSTVCCGSGSGSGSGSAWWDPSGLKCDCDNGKFAGLVSGGFNKCWADDLEAAFPGVDFDGCTHGSWGSPQSSSQGKASANAKIINDHPDYARTKGLL